MTPARSLAASVVALGFASAFTPQPALAAPAPCEQAEIFAAQSGAESLRIDKLEVRARAAERPRAKSDPADAKAEESTTRDAGGRVLSGDAESVIPDPADSDTLSEGIGLIGTGTLGHLGLLPKSTAQRAGVGPVTPVKRGEALDGTVSDVGVGEARTAMIGSARITSAAYARVLNGSPDDQASATPSALVQPLLQYAPPTNDKAVRRSTPAGKAGPVRLGSGEIGTQARWDAGMACGRVAGETGRATAALTGVRLLGSGNGALVRVPSTMTSQGTTALENRGGELRSVARSTVTAGRIELAGGQVLLRILRAPALEATTSATSGGQVSYRPAIVEVSGDGIATKRLRAAGEHVDLALTPDRQEMESALLRSLTDLDELSAGEPLPVPAIPGLPPVATPEIESAPVSTSGIKLRISLGDVRQAVKGNAVSAKAAAIRILVGSRDRGENGYGGESSVSLSLSVGVLEAAAVSPESSAGAGGGLPVTGSNLAGMALVGGGLLLAGAAAVLLSLRRRRSHP